MCRSLLPTQFASHINYTVNYQSYMTNLKNLRTFTKICGKYICINIPTEERFIFVPHSFNPILTASYKKLGFDLSSPYLTPDQVVFDFIPEKEKKDAESVLSS